MSQAETRTPRVSRRPTLAAWKLPEHLSWSFRHVRELIPTARVARGAVASALPRRELGEPLPGVQELMQEGYTDGLLVIHGGEVVCEEYGRGMRPDDTHLLMSISKSVTGTLAGVLVERGALAPEDEVVAHVPELAGTSFEGASVRDLLDMRTGTRYDETYEDPKSDIVATAVQWGWAPGTPPAPDGISYLAGLENAREHGGPFEYRSILTNALGLVLERAAGEPLAELLGRELWAPMGAQSDADLTVNREGFAVAGGGICATLRDLGRFGRLILDDGAIDGRQVVPASWIADTLRGGPDSTAAFAGHEYETYFPGGHYRNQWWVPAGERELFGLGINGQHLYIDRGARVVIAKLSTWPTPLNYDLRTATLAAFRTIADHLTANSPA